jgi:hypothetical protein
MSNARPLPPLIGRTENALRPLLVKILSTTSIKTYPAWVVLNAASSADGAQPPETWKHAAADALKFEPDRLDAIIDELHVADLLGRNGALTEQGLAELTRTRSVVSATTARLVEGLDDEAQDTARLVLDHILRKAEELAHA